MKLKILLHRFSSFPCYLHMLAHASMDCFFCLPSCKALRNIWAKHRSENNRHKRFQLIFLKGHLVSCCPNRPTDCNNEQSTQKILPRTENIKHRHGLPNRRRVGVLRTTPIIPHTNFTGEHKNNIWSFLSNWSQKEQLGLPGHFLLFISYLVKIAFFILL
jgi:hypothetical protein